MKVIEELEKIQKEFCYTRCKYLAAAQTKDVKSLEDLEKITENMKKICALCPLKRI